MGTASEGSDGGGIVGDCGVGTIVWVRRRNGSWWPGRILGLEELVDSHVISSRSGTPVKLLGREDASVDWYNLEKSKRVKPFRCREFDACIERAEVSHSSPIKKREKYARREDAILHALELEKQQLDECHLDLPLPAHRNTSISEDHNDEIATHISAEDDSPEVVKPKGKLFLPVAGGNSDITDDDHSDLLPHGGQTVIGNKFSVFKRKTLPPSAINDNPAKRRDRRRPLVKVLQNSTEFPFSYSFQASHGLSGDPMPAEGDLISMANDARKNTTVHRSLGADDPLDYSSNSWKHEPADSGNACQLQEPGCMSDESTPSGWTEENDFDSSATDSEIEMVEEELRSAIIQPSKQPAETSIESRISQWHLKGKRKNRIILKALREYADGTHKSNLQFRETSPEEAKPTTPNALEPEFLSEKEIDSDSEEDGEISTGLAKTRDDLERRRHSDDVDSDDDRELISEPGRGSPRPFQMWKACWEHDPTDQFYAPTFSYRMVPMLIDVDLKVQARYRGGHVPLVSMISKLNGMAIVGHPVRIEVVEDGSADLLLLLPSNEFGDSAAPPIWRTAKRTSMHHLPRSNPDPPNDSHLLPAAQAKRKRFYHAHRSASGRFQRKPLRTASSSSGQKTRALASFVPDKKLSNGAFLGGLIKVDGSMPPATCIPTKVVFGRILESVGRPFAAERGSS